MKRRTLLLALATFALADGTPAQDAVRKLHGLYSSGFQNGPQRLRAEFRPRDDGSWQVDFFFRFNGQDRIYSGVAAGSLSEGLLHGRVQDESRQRKFTFRCRFDKKRRCKGTHAEVVRTGEHETGTITLRE